MSLLRSLQVKVLIDVLHGRRHHRALRSTFFCRATYSEMRHLLCQSLSVCLSVCHTRDPRVKRSRCQNICFAPHNRGTFLASGDQICNTEFRACCRNDCVKQRQPLATAKIGPIMRHISGTCNIERNLLLFTHRKSHTCFPLVP